ncbi:DUF5995 family protein [Nocardia sp. XZ_19_385]|uniref:DUF5995 family protein n=1 Tax=Nocardia sp. XZ_19_385 TaxID=2769488 RepID=UPI0018900F5A|nr:DUF5995 family protein [Nocardia sp. XZ_19_385]
MTIAGARTAVLIPVFAAILATVGIAAPTASANVSDTVCGTPLSQGELTSIARLSDTTALAGSSMDRLEQAVDNHRQITEILVRHRDRRGVLALGLNGVEYAAVMPLQRDPAAFANPEWAHRISLELLSRFLDNLHAEFTGALAAPHWAHYFTLARQCDLSAARVAMAGYNAHLTVDLTYSVAAVGSTPENAPDYFRIVDSIAQQGPLIIDSTKAIYNGDLGPLWRFYFVGEGLDAVLGAGVATGPLLRLADAGANVFIFTNGLALQDPALAPAVRAEIDLLWPTADTAFAVLSANGGL